jgi:predicted dehydrogenase
MDKFRVAFIGAGGFARDIMASVGHCRHIEVAGGFDSASESLRSFANDYSVRAYESLDTLLSDKNIEGVLIVTPNDTHATLIEKAARAGKHVFVEKPITNDISEAKAAIKAAADAGVTLFVGHVARRASTVRLARQVLDSGCCGKLVLIEGNIAHNGGLRLQSNEWRWYRKRCPGGPLMQLAVHVVDTLQYLAGPVKSVCAKSSRLVTPAEIDDVGVMALEFESGALGYVGTGYVIPSTNYLKIHGVNAAVEARRNGSVVVTYDNDRVESLSPVVAVNPIADELDQFALDARTGGRPETGGEEGLRALAVILAAVRSSEEERTVTIEEMLKGK